MRSGSWSRISSCCVSLENPAGHGWRAARPERRSVAAPRHRRAGPRCRGLRRSGSRRHPDGSAHGRRRRSVRRGSRHGGPTVRHRHAAPVIVEQRVEPFDVVGREPQARVSRAWRAAISSQARLTAIRRRSASFTASSGTPRASIRSGWVARTSARQRRGSRPYGRRGPRPARYRGQARHRARSGRASREGGVHPENLGHAGQERILGRVIIAVGGGDVKQPLHQVAQHASTPQGLPSARNIAAMRGRSPRTPPRPPRQVEDARRRPRPRGGCGTPRERP
jgi:hypothetical protein